MQAKKFRRFSSARLAHAVKRLALDIAPSGVSIVFEGNKKFITDISRRRSVSSFTSSLRHSASTSAATDQPFFPSRCGLGYVVLSFLFCQRQRQASVSRRGCVSNEDSVALRLRRSWPCVSMFSLRFATFLHLLFVSAASARRARGKHLSVRSFVISTRSGTCKRRPPPRTNRPIFRCTGRNRNSIATGHCARAEALGGRSTESTCRVVSSIGFFP